MKDGNMFAGLYGYEEPAFREEHPVVDLNLQTDAQNILCSLC